MKKSIKKRGLTKGCGFTKRKIIISSIICVFAIIFAVGGIYIAYLLNKFNHIDIDKSNEALGINSLRPAGNGITNIALYGIDDDGNSDSVMIISINQNTNKIKLLSVLRDSLVLVEPKDKKSYYTKITEAYDYGPETAIKALNRNFNLDIENYAAIKFDGMAKVIDAVGGIDINITEAERDMINGLIQTTKELTGPLLKSYGDVHLNGNQAVAYSRIRKINNQNGQYGDYGRTDRQRTVLEQLFHAALKINYSQYPSFINSLLPYVETSMGVNDIMSLAGIMTKSGVDFEQARVPDTTYTIDANFNYNGKSTVYYSLDYASKLINAFIFDDVSTEDFIANNQAPSEGPLGSKGPSLKSGNSSASSSDESKSSSGSNSKSSSGSKSNTG